jgi:DNA-binding NarL/FixJ family response regulator
LVRRVLIIEDHPIFRQGLSASLQTHGITVCEMPGPTSDKAMREEPEVLLVGVSRIQVLADQPFLAASRKYPKANVLAIISEEDLALAASLFSHGVKGCISRRQGILDYLQAIDKVGRADYYFEREWASELLQQLLAAQPDYHAEAWEDMRKWNTRSRFRVE